MFRWARLLIPGSLLCAAILTAAQAGLWLDVPFVRQEKDGCGAAVISMVMQYWQRQQPNPQQANPRVVPDAAEIQRVLYSRNARGIYASDLEQFLQQQGFRTFAFRGQWTDLQQHLGKGRPLIVALQSGRDDLHYVVITGLNPQEGIVLKNDPAERKLLKQRQSEFEKEWKAAGNWTLLAVPNVDNSVSP
jgi:ABC-type bacteriocin/lantibiotic exporter with double-glycine peptidase domain